MFIIKPIIRKIRKEIIIPADKSISHRAAILASLAEGKTCIEPFLLSEDTLATLNCLKKCGVKSHLKGNCLTISGEGLYLPIKKRGCIQLYAQESGTTIRILSGLLCAQKSQFSFTAAPSLQKRPMARVTQPLRLMGADIYGKKIHGKEYPPIEIQPVEALKAIDYKMPVASAQVKSAVLLASLYARGQTRVIEPFVSRDHTERMLCKFGVEIKRKGNVIICQKLKTGQYLSLQDSDKNLFIPSDFSSAAFFVVLGLIIKDSEIMLKDINLNPTRCGLLAVLKSMGADIKIVNKKNYFEPYGDILIKSSKLKCVEVRPNHIPLIIDEIPILAVAASFARGKTRIWSVGELKVKETDRLQAIVYNLERAGIKIAARQYMKTGQKNWMLEIEGASKFKPAEFASFSDHRIAMSMIVLGKAIDGQSSIDDVDCINKSFPRFIKLIETL